MTKITIKKIARFFGFDIFSLQRLIQIGGRNPGVVVMGGDSCPEVVGFNPRAEYWTDHFLYKFFVKIILMFEQPKNFKKEDTVSHIIDMKNMEASIG